MQIKIRQIQDLAQEILLKQGFSEEEVQYCLENCTDAELSGKKTHGFVRVLALTEFVKKGDIKVNDEASAVAIEKETPVSLLINGQKRTGLYVVNKTLEMAINKLKESKTGMIAAGVTNTAPMSGFIGSYARKAAEEDLIYIGFNNSSSALIPHGSTKDLWGTNPFTVAIPSENLPVILDMASTKITWGDLVLASARKDDLEENVALDDNGNPTTDPDKAMLGGLLPIAGHKGSGLAFIIELLAGALTGSLTGHSVKGGWGSFFILIDPSIMRPLEDFKHDVQTAVNELKEAPKRDGVKEIYFPGEHSQKLRQENLKKGTLDIDDEVYEKIMALR